MTEKMHTRFIREAMQEADIKKISPFIVMKRKVNYRDSSSNYKCCAQCRNRQAVNFCGKGRNQCIIIGISCNSHADVIGEKVCDYYKF